MDKKLRKYAELLINRCLNVKKEQPLLITAPVECYEFVRIIANVALESGVNDIYFDYDDEVIKHDELKYLNKEDLKKSRFFNKKIYDEYAKKNAAFLILCADNPDIMKDIEDEKVGYAAKITRTTKPIYKKKQLTYEVPWCIACVSTDAWAKKVLPNSKNSKEDLWNLIFKMCLADKKEPIIEWNNKIKDNNKLVKKLNDLKIKTLHFKNKLGTDFTVSFNDNIWCGAGCKATDGRDIIVNMPTEEVFTTPNKFTANGIVYASLPLVYNGSTINDFYFKFENGKVIDYGAKTGKNILKTILDTKNGNYLGEVALVDVTSPISKSNTLFYDTLYDENASCHLALGDAFTECIKSKKDEKELGLNKSQAHVDFMIGTKDLLVTAETINGKEVTIMKNGKFTI